MGRSSGRFPFQDRAAPETSRTTAISSADKNILACGGLLALLRGQNSIFFFDVSEPRRPRFMFSTSGTLSNITDDFLPLKDGGFLVTQMGSHTGGTPGRVAEFDANLRLVGEWPDQSPGA